jgi:2-polyprenyl-3-methyl-5-hydroxy-6-metoxy-1,4-benzoquinol methylase
MDEQLYDAFHRLERSHWWFIARQRILLEITRRFVAPGGRILDVGCGTGYYLEEATKEFDAHGIDISDIAVRMCHSRGLTTVTSHSLHDLAERAVQPFNAIMFLDVLEHMDEDVDALVAARRLLSPGGVVVITVPSYMFLWSPHDVANQHRRRYLAGEVRTRLAAAGFQVELLTYFNTLLFPLALARRVTQRVMRRDDYDELAMPAPWLNRGLCRIFSMESPFVRRAGRRGLFPFGLSVAAVGRAGVR